MDLDAICTIKRVISVDMHPKDYFKMRREILTRIDQKLAKEQRVEEIELIMKTILSDDDFREYNCIIGISPTYNLLSKKNTVWIFKIEEVAFFIFQAKPVDIPRIHKIEIFSEPDVLEKGQILAQQIKIKEIEGFEEDSTFITGMKEWIACYFVKYEDLRKENLSVFEKEFAYRFKMFLLSNWTTCHWHFFLSKKMAYVLSRQHNYPETNSVISLSLDFPEYSNLKHKPSLLVFQRRTVHEIDFMTMDWAKNKWREILIFLAALLMFYIFTSCPTDSSLAIGKGGLQGIICPNKGEISMYAGFIMILLVGFGMIMKKREQNNEKKARQEKKQN